MASSLCLRNLLVAPPSLAISIVLVAVAPALADTFEWTDPNDGNFDDPSNWTVTNGAGPPPPGIGDTVEFNETGSYSVTFTQNEVSDLLNVTAGDATFLSDSAAVRFYSLSDGAADANISGGNLTIGQIGNPVSLGLGDPFGSALRIGDGANGSVDVVGTGSSLSTGVFQVQKIGENGASGSLSIIEGATATIQSNAGLQVGVSSDVGTSGSILVDTGGTLNVTNLSIATGTSNTSSTVTVTGSTSVINQTVHPLTVGSATGGDGTLDIKNEGTFHGTTAATTINASGKINVGVFGGGTFNANGDITVDGGTLRSGSTGDFTLGNSLTVTAMNDSLIDLNTIYEIDDDTTFDIQSDAELRVDGLRIGTSGDGTLLVDGLGSRLFVEDNDFYSWGTGGNTANVTIRNNATAIINTSILQVASGAGSTGVFNIESGASVLMSNLAVASVAGADTSGTVNVDGLATELTLGLLAVGDDVDGTGTVNVSNGGTLTAAQAVIDVNGAVNLSGGTISLADETSLTNFGGTFNFFGGVFELRDDSSITPSFTNGALGGNTIGIGRELRVLGAATLSTGLSISGGTLTAGSLNSMSLVQLDSGTLRLTNQAVTIEPSGPLGNVLDLSSNMTLVVDLGMTNNGLVSGDGTIGGSFTNSTSGEMQVLFGDNLVLTGVGNTNQGQVTLSGGQIHFMQDLTNSSTGLVIGNGTLRADGGTTNDGNLAFSATANVIGDVTNNASGLISSSGGTTTFFDDVTNNGEIRTNINSFSVYFGSYSGNGDTGTGTVIMEGDLKPGSSPGTMEFGGDLSFGPSATLEIEIGGLLAGSEYDRVAVAGFASLDGTLDVSLLNGFVPEVGDNFGFLFASGGYGGSFDAMNLPDIGVGKEWFINTGASTLFLEVRATLPGDFDFDGDVDGADFLLWQTDPSIGALSDWETNYGMTAPLAAATFAVPEPSTALLLLALATFCLVGIKQR